MKRVLTLCIIHQHPRVLLGMKKRGFGAGRWNGFGGKVEYGECIEEGVKREIKEEIGIEVKDIEKIGIINFEFQDGSKTAEVHIFRSKDFEGEVIESEEMRPEWFDVNELPYKNMWPADAYWLPVVLEGKKFNGRFFYDHPSTPEFASTILEHELIEVEEI